MSQSPAQLESNVLISIWQNDLEQLEKNLKLFDVNKIISDPALCAAERLNRAQCKQLLIKYHANEAFAKLYNLTRDYCLLFPPAAPIKLSNQLSDRTVIDYKIDSTVKCPSYGVGLIATELQHYSKKNTHFKKTQEMLRFSIENYYCNTVYDEKAILKRVKKGKTTLINTGWCGAPSHIIGVIIHKNYLIVGDGLRNKINIYPIKQKNITQKMIHDLLECPQGSSAHQKLIEQIVEHKKPLFQLNTETQNYNCGIFSHLSALQGLWFLFNLEQGLSIKEADYQAKKQRTDFNNFMKKSILKRVDKNEKAKKLLKNILPRSHKEGSYYSNTLKFGLCLATVVYLGIAFTTGVFFSQFALMGLLGGFGLGVSIFSLGRKMSNNNLLCSNISLSNISNLVQKEEKNIQYLNLWLNAKSECRNSNNIDSVELNNVTKKIKIK